MTTSALAPLEGKYEIVAKLNEGGMGAIYKVRHRLLDEVRVVKVLRPQFENDADLNIRFANEARAAIRLRHPNVVQIFDFLFEEGMGYIVMEHIEGIDLAELIKNDSRPSLPVSIEVARQSLRALGYLHQQGFVHRDISPDNLMLSLDYERNPLVKIIDLGISKNVESDQRLTASGMFLGKFRYSSPEHFGAQGPDGIESRSDLYSFGIVLYEFLTGCYPIQGKDNSQLIAGHLFHPPHDFAETDPGGRVPKTLRQIVLRGLDKDPDRRFPTAEEFSKSLGEMQDQFPMTEPAREEVRALVAHQRTELAPSDHGSTQGRLDRGFVAGPTPAPNIDAPTIAREDRQSAQLDALMAGAETLHQLGHSEQARTQLDALLLIDPENTRARQILTEIDGTPAPPPSASQVSPELSASSVPGPPRTPPPAQPDPRQAAFEQHLQAACSLAEDQHHTDAVLHFEAALEIQPDNEAVREMLAEARGASDQQHQAARAQLEREVQTLRDLLAEGKLEDARSRLLSARRGYGDDPMLAEVQAEIEAVEVAGQRATLLGRIAEASEQRRGGELTMAVQLLERAREEAHGMETDPEVAEKIADEDAELEDAHRRAAEVDEAIYQVESLISAGRLVEADRVLFQALEASNWDPLLAKVRDHLDQIHHKERDYKIRQLMDKAAEKALEDDLTEARAFLHRAEVAAPDEMQAEITQRQQELQAQRNRGDEEAALRQLEDKVNKSLESDGPQAAQRVLEGAVVRLNGPEATKVFANLRETIADGYQGRVNVLIKDAGLAFEEKRYRDAIRFLEEAVQIDPSDDWLRDRLQQARATLAAPDEPAVAAEKIADLIDHEDFVGADYELRKAIERWGRGAGLRELQELLEQRRGG